MRGLNIDICSIKSRKSECIMPSNPVAQIYDIVVQLCSKIESVFSTLLGRAILLMTFMGATFGPKAMLIHWILIALGIDLFFGCWSSLKMKNFHISYALTSTAIKLVMYVALFVMPLILDKVIDLDVSALTVLVTVVLVSAEFFSALAHMLIIKPDLFGARLVRKILMGEVAKKMNMSCDELEKYFRNEKAI